MTSFDLAAAGYDDVAESVLGRELRARVHELVLPLIKPGTRTLDIGAGTGLDAATYVAAGADLTAIEPSPNMAAAVRERLGGAGSVHVVGALAAEIDDTFDLVTSNFGAVNCIADLSAFASRCRDWTLPGGHLVLVVMGRWVPWELLGGARHLDRDRLRRRFVREQGEVRYRSHRQVDGVLGPDFVALDVRGLGSVLPTYQQRSAVEHRPRLARALARGDRAIARATGRLGVGDHWIGRWRRR